MRRSPPSFTSALVAAALALPACFELPTPSPAALDAASETAVLADAAPAPGVPATADVPAAKPDALAAVDAAAAQPDAGANSPDLGPPFADVAATPGTGPGPDATPDAAADVSAAEVTAGETATTPPVLPVPAPLAITGLQYNGSAGFVRKAKSGTFAEEFVEISASILPKVLVLYKQEGANFPKTLQGMQKLAHDAALTFDFLLAACKPKYSGITLQPADATKPLTKDQMWANFNLVAQCSYEQYTAKPYWIPKLVDQVDICQTELGHGWRLLAEADIVGFTPAEITTVADALTSKGERWGGFYFSLAVYLRGLDGILKLGQIKVGGVINPIPANSCGGGCNGEDVWLHHLEGGFVLRCIRIRGIQPDN